MDIGTMFKISGSALGAEKRRLEVIAENLAGANTTRTAKGGPYRRQDVVFKTFKDHLGQARDNNAPDMVKATVQPDTRPFQMVFKPGHPDANEEGYVQMPNVNTMEEMTNMISATRSYEANVKAIQATKAMIRGALQIGQ
ncbi:MAG: flagellar basal body rod protein FlgC [Leptospirillia bacterium]